MTERATREMTFDEEYEILQSEKNELFAKENDNEEPPFANCVVRRALRCIRKLKEEREQYRAIGTVEQIMNMQFTTESEHDEVLKYRAIGTVSEFRELKEKATAKAPDLDQNEDGEDCLECPNCGAFIGYGIDCLETHYQDNYCACCGQRLSWFDWSEGKE